MRLLRLAAVKGLRVDEGVQHELAPGDGGVNRQMGVAVGHADSDGSRAVTRAVPAVAELSQTLGDDAHRAEDAAYTVATSGPEPGLGVEAESSRATWTGFGRSEPFVVSLLLMMGFSLR